MKKFLARLLACVVAFLGAPVAAQQPETATVAFRSDLPRSFHLERVRISVDGFVWVDGPVAMVRPGTHDVAVEAEYSLAHAHARRVRFTVRSSEHVRTPAGQVVLVRAVELGGEAPPEKRVQIRWSPTLP